MRGIPYEELYVGQEASFSKTITEADIILFAGISGDFNPIHTDEEYAKTTPFGRRIAHGVLPFSLIAPVLGMRLPGMGTVVVEVSVRFLAPTFIGDTVTAKAHVKEKIEERKRVRMGFSCQNQRGETILVGEALVIPPRVSKGKETLSA
ncbi:MAG: MaoC family dehydratase [Desulfatiglandales bacterium]